MRCGGVADHLPHLGAGGFHLHTRRGDRDFLAGRPEFERNIHQQRHAHVQDHARLLVFLEAVGAHLEIVMANGSDGKE